MIKAIIFDSHDTVIRNGLNFVLKKGQVLKSATWKPFWRGKITEDEFWRRVAADEGKNEAWIKRSMIIYYSKSIPFKGILTLVRKLKKKYKLGFLANAPKPWVDDAISRFNLDKIFDVLVSSGETGLLKPDKEIYLLTCQKLGVPTRECLYIDDDHVKLKAAQELGMKGILFKNIEQLEKRLKRGKFLG
jgi:putative hydrolase of the HAD superfamily